MKRLYLTLSISLLILSSLATVVWATNRPSSPTPQTAQTFPTATFLPVDDLEYTIEQVMPNTDMIKFDDQEIDGFSFTNFTYESLYPRGLDFKATIKPSADEEIIAVTLFYEFAGGARSREQAVQTESDNEWQAVPYATGGLPPWQFMTVTFRISTASGLSIETEPVTVHYHDPTRSWWRAESVDAVIYWFDFPQEFGDVLMPGIAAVQDKYEKGFGGRLSYRPIVIIFPPGDVLGEYRAGGQNNPRTTGSASRDTQSAVLRIRGLDIEEIRQDCIWNEPRDLDWQMEFSMSVATHEIAHLYQYEFFNGVGPAWWIEGQATFFEWDSGQFDDRMRNLAQTQDLATLQGSGPSGMVGTPASDGCTHLGYEMGTSFINWFVNTQGGYEAHRQVVELMDSNVLLAEALEQVSGVPFAELEMQWREYIGLNPEPFIRPTPTFPSFPTQAPFSGSN